MAISEIINTKARSNAFNSYIYMNMLIYAYITIIKKKRPSNCKEVGEYMEGVSEKKGNGQVI